MPPKAHANLGASKAKRWMNCPGSVNLEADIPDGESSPYALEGSAAHELAEKCLLKGTDADEYVDTAFLLEGKTVEVTEEMAEAVQVFLDHVRGLKDEGDTLLVEQRFDLSPLDPPGPMFGTSDAVIWKPEDRHLHVLDYKHGQGVAVDAKENDQLLYYSLGALLEINQKPGQITATIVQPRGFHPAGPIRSFTFDFDYLYAWKQQLFEAAEATTRDDAPLAVGDWCRFCKALPTCPAQRKNAIEVAQDEFDVAEEFDPPAPELLTTEQLALVLERGDQVTDWIRAVQAHAVTLLEVGEEVPGYKLVEGRSNRRWTDEEAAEKYLANKGLTVDERFKRKLVSPAQAEKALKRAGKLGSARKLPALIEKPQGRPKLVPADDRRPALPPAATEDFDIPVEVANDA